MYHQSINNWTLVHSAQANVKSTFKPSVYHVKSSLSSLTTGLILPPVTSTGNWISVVAVSRCLDVSAWNIKHARKGLWLPLYSHISKMHACTWLTRNCGLMLIIGLASIFTAVDDRSSMEGNAIGCVCPSVRFFPVLCFEPTDLWPWPLHMYG